MLRFYRYTAHTAIPGEEQTAYAIIPALPDGSEDRTTVDGYAMEFADSNAEEWWDEDHEVLFSWEDYLNDSFCDIEEIDEKTYRSENVGFSGEIIDNTGF